MSSNVFRVPKDLFEIALEVPRDPEGEFERRRIFFLFDGVDRLATRAHFIRQFLLRRSAVETKLADPVPNPASRFAHERRYKTRMAMPRAISCAMKTVIKPRKMPAGETKSSGISSRNRKRSVSKTWTINTLIPATPAQ